MRMGVAMLLVLLFAPAAAGAAAPKLPQLLKEQVAELEGGVAIAQYSARKAGPRARFARRLEATGAETAFFRKLPMVALRGTPAELRRAARVRGVRYVHMDRPFEVLLHESVDLVYRGGQESAWSAGYDGRGVSVAVVDTGVDGTHPDLASRVTKNVKVVADLDRLFGTDTPPVLVECPAACNTDTTGGHGTHVAGTVAGDGSASQGYHTGVAPGAGIVGLSVGDGLNILWALAAFDYVLAHPELNVKVVNNSWGPQGDRQRFDYTAPVSQATLALHRAGISVVFAAGNSGSGTRTDPEGASDCSTVAGEAGREPSEGACKINVNSVAPWVISVANGRKDADGGPGAQPINFSSSRGDPVPQISLDGRPVRYLPTVTAPGTNIWAARDPQGLTGVTCGASAEAPSCIPPNPAYLVHYVSLSGTSMAAPHVAGAVAVLQSAAKAKLRRFLSPDEVRALLTSTAARMTVKDGLWDWPCGSTPLFVQCGAKTDGTTGLPYESWQVGAGGLDLAAALDRVGRLPRRPRR